MYSVSKRSTWDLVRGAMDKGWNNVPVEVMLLGMGHSLERKLGSDDIFLTRHFDCSFCGFEKEVEKDEETDKLRGLFGARQAQFFLKGSSSWGLSSS